MINNDKQSIYIWQQQQQKSIDAFVFVCRHFHSSQSRNNVASVRSALAPITSCRWVSSYRSIHGGGGGGECALECLTHWFRITYIYNFSRCSILMKHTEFVCRTKGTSRAFYERTVITTAQPTSIRPSNMCARCACGGCIAEWRAN